jgi:hypothetical protein
MRVAYMRKNFTTPKMTRLLKAATILSIGGLAAGCSSDAMRFSDDFYTAAVPRSAATQPAQTADYGQPNYNPNIDRSPTGSVTQQAFGRAGMPPSAVAPIATPQPAMPVGGTANAAAAQTLPQGTSPVTTGSISPAPVARTAVGTGLPSATPHP